MQDYTKGAYFIRVGDHDTEVSTALLLYHKSKAIPVLALEAYRVMRC
jgi:hypothetical protein